MTISTLSPKNQTTLSAAFIRQLNLPAGTRFKQFVRDGTIVLEPVPDVFSAFGALRPKRKFVSIDEETQAMERAMAKKLGSKAN
jgi:hypothetical protein